MDMKVFVVPKDKNPPIHIKPFSHQTSRKNNFRKEFDESYNPNFSKLFYQKVNSLRSFFGIKQENEHPYQKMTIRHIKAPVTLIDPLPVLPPKVTITRKSKNFSIENQRKTRRPSKCCELDMSSQRKPANFKIRKSTSNQSIRKKIISLNVPSLPFI